MDKPKKNNNFIFHEFSYHDKLTIFTTIIGAVIMFYLIFKYNFPVYLIYIFIMFS